MGNSVKGLIDINDTGSNISGYNEIMPTVTTDNYESTYEISSST